MKVTSACATSVAPTYAERVSVPVTRLLAEPDAVPSSAVAEAGWMKEAAPLEEKVTVAPETGLPYASPIVATSAVVVPLAGTAAGEARSVDPEGLGRPAATSKGALVATGASPLVALSRYPEPASRIERSAKGTVPPVEKAVRVPWRAAPAAPPVTARSTGVESATVFPKASWISTSTAGAITSPATTPAGWVVKRSAAAGPATKVAVAWAVTATPSMDTASVFSPATVEVSVTEALPSPPVVAVLEESDAVPATWNAAVTPEIGAPEESFAVAIRVTVATPSAVTGEGEVTRVDRAASTRERSSLPAQPATRKAASAAVTARKRFM